MEKWSQNKGKKGENNEFLHTAICLTHLATSLIKFQKRLRRSAIFNKVAGLQLQL